jgi:TRAP-type uncharacterized transport system substrate-binding protein
VRNKLEWLKVYLPGIALALAVMAFAWQYVEPAPPDTIRLAVGPADSSYHWLGERYQEILKPQGLQVELVESKGSQENLELIRDGKADAAFVQSGVNLGKDDKTDLFFLASLFPEPLWIFSREDEKREDLLHLSGKKLGIGPEGSGSRALALSILSAMGLEQTNTLTEDSDPEMLRSGELDYLFLVTSPNSPTLRGLLEDESLHLVSLRRAPGLVKHFEFVSFITLHEGAVDLAKNLPDKDVSLVASTATLVVGEKFHPALTGVVLGAADKVHGQPGPLQERDNYPSAAHGSFPLTQEAQYYHKNGPGFLQGKIPYKVAATLERMIILLLPFLTIVLPLAKILPALYAWRLNRRLHEPYKELLRLENEVGEDSFLEEIDKVEKDARKLADMPASYGADVHNLLAHIERLKRKHEKQTTNETLSN